MMIDAVRQQAIALRLAGDPETALRKGLEALAIVEEVSLEERKEYPEILLLCANCATDLGDHEQAVFLLERAGRIFKEAKRPAALAQVNIALGRALAESGDEEASFRLFSNLGQMELPAGLRSQVLNNLGVLCERRGAFDEAKGWFEADVNLCKLHNDEMGIAIAKLNLGRVLSAQGDSHSAKRMVSEANAYFDRTEASAYQTAGKQILDEIEGR